MSTQDTKSQQPPKSKKLLMLLGAIFITVTLIAASELISKKENELASQPFVPVLGKHYVELELSSETKDILSKLSIDPEASFEMMSYTCPACRANEEVLAHITEHFGVKFEKLQIGNRQLEMAESEYMVKTFSPDNFAEFRALMFEQMQSGAPLSSLKVIAHEAPILFDVSEAQLAEAADQAKEYATLTSKLAESLNVNQTPTVFLHGRYQIMQGAHRNFGEYIATILYVIGAHSPTQVAP